MPSIYEIQNKRKVKLSKLIRKNVSLHLSARFKRRTKKESQSLCSLKIKSNSTNFLLAHNSQNSHLLLAKSPMKIVPRREILGLSMLISKTKLPC